MARAFGVCSGGPGRDDRVEMMGDDRVERERRGGGLSLTGRFYERCCTDLNLFHA